MSPYRIPEMAGKPYRPSNGTEAMMFEERNCSGCKIGQESCGLWIDSILGIQVRSWTHNEAGEPVCTKREEK